LKVKVKGQRSRSPGTKTAFFNHFRGLCAVYVWWNIISPSSVRSSFFNTTPRDWQGRTSPKWPVLCQVGCKTLIQSITQSNVPTNCQAACIVVSSTLAPDVVSCKFFLPHMYLVLPLGWPHWNFIKVVAVRKLESLGLHVALVAGKYVQLFWENTGL